MTDRWVDDDTFAQAEDTTFDGPVPPAPTVRQLRCPYCGPFQLCRARTPDECHEIEEAV